MPVLGTGFYQWEGNGKGRWTWSSGDAYVILLNPSSKSRRVRLSFTLSSLIERSVKTMLEKQTLRSFVLARDVPESVFGHTNLNETEMVKIKH